nr:monodehydroascorbate reductase [Tanacetum cinerariifolium]
MADVNAPSDQTPTMASAVRADDQILPYIRWILIGKSNCDLDQEKSQSNPIYKIAVDLLKNTNFFRAFTASSNLPSIYIQQFWDTIQYDKKAGCYKYQLDEQWFDLTKETLREALQITPVNRNQAFAAPPSINGLIDFVNQLGYPKFYGALSQEPILITPRGSGRNLPNPYILLLKTNGICLSIHQGKEGHSDCDSKRLVHQADHPPPSEEAQFSAKGTKREIFGMPIPGRLITVNIREASYYQEYQENVAKHRGFLAGETKSTQDLPAPKPAKPARKPYISRKTRQSRSSPKSVGESKAEEVPAEEPQIVDKDTNFQKSMEESMKETYALPKNRSHQWSSGNLNIEDESEKIVLRVEKGGQDEGQTGPDPNAQAEGQTGSDTSSQAEGQAGSNPDETSEGQAGSNPDETSDGQARPDPGNAKARVQSTLSHVVHAGSDREQMDIDVANLSPQPSTKQLYEGFNATVYPNVQENLKLAVKEPVLLEEPASSSGTLSSLQHISRDFTFRDQFFSDKPSDADKSAETKVESMVNVLIQQALSSISLMTSPIIDLTLRPESPKEHQQLKATTTDTTTTTTITFPPPQAPQQSTTEAMMVSIAVSEVVTDAVDWAMQAPLRNRFRDLPEADMKEILHQRMWESNSYKSHEDHMQLFEALEKSINRDHSEELTHDLTEARKKRKKGRESPKMPPGSPSHQPPPPPPPAGPSGTSRAHRASGSQVTPPPPTSTNQDSSSKGSAAPSPTKTAATTEHQACSTPDVTLKPLVSLTPEDLDIDEAMGLDEQAQLSDEEDIESAHIPTVNLRQGWWKPFEEERPTTPEPAWSIRSSDIGDITTFMDWFCKRRGITELKPQDLEGPAYEIVKVLHPDMIHLQYQMEECHKLLTDSVDEPILRHNISKPLPLEGPPGQVTIQSDFFFNKDLEYLRYEQMVLDQFWIEEECKYDIAHSQDTHANPQCCKNRSLFCVWVRLHEKVVLRRADLNEHVIAERDFKQLVIRQRVEDFQLGIESYQTQVNLTKPQWTATGFEYKHDYTIIESPRAVIFQDKYEDQQDESRSKYKVLDQEGRRSVQRIHVRNSEAFEDTENLLQPGELCWRTRQRGRLQTFEAYLGFNSLAHSLRALSALRRFDLRTASTAAKPYQGHSSEFYLITGSIHTDQRGTVVLA